MNNRLQFLVICDKNGAKVKVAEEFMKDQNALRGPL